MIAALLSLVLAVQDDPSALVEQLRSDRAETRRDARRKLKDLGKAARPELEKATRDGDAEVSGTAKELLRVLSVTEKLTPALMQRFPGVDERLASGSDRTWMEVFLEAARSREGAPALRREDLEPLAAPAVRGADSRSLKHDVMAQACTLQLRSAAPAMARLLQDEEEGVAEITAFFLGYLGSKEAVPDLVRALQSTNQGVVKRSLSALGQLRAAEAAPDLAKLLGSPLRKTALKALVQCDARAYAPAIVKLLKDPDVEVRVAAASGLCSFGMDDGVPVILKDGESKDLDWEDSPALTFLNALRRPESWRKLAGKPMEWKLTDPWGFESPRQDLLDRVAREAGLKLDVLPDLKWGQDVHHLQKWCGPLTLPQGVLVLLYNSGYDILLEEDRIRIVSHDSALKFWREWWKERQEKK